MASARDDITLGPVLEEISSQPNSSSSSSTSAAVAELPAVPQLLKNIDSERTIIDSSRVSPNRGGAYIETATHAAAYLIAALHAGLDRHNEYYGLASPWSSSAIQDVPPLHHLVWGPTMAHSE